MPTSHKSQVFCKQGFRDTKAIFCLLGKLPNPHRTLPAASGCASVPDASTAVPAKEKSPVQNEHYTHTAPDFPSSTTLSIFFFLPHFLLMQLLFFLLVPFQDFLHSLLCSRPILHTGQFDQQITHDHSIMGTANDKSYDTTHDNLEDDTHQDIHQVSHQDSMPSAVILRLMLFRFSSQS